MEVVMDAGVEKMLTADGVADRFGLSIHWLKRARSGGYGPPFRLLGHRTVRYYASEVQAWLDSTVATRVPASKGRAA